MCAAPDQCGGEGSDGSARGWPRPMKSPDIPGRLKDSPGTAESSCSEGHAPVQVIVKQGGP
jgi:hypothetical protein